ncbi:MAG TPA: glycosyltransferase family 39 protein [Gaiellaceae bacterium]|nr:glycosyltransferase family 39 protein [Gaiellaceae bacterium]
MRRSTAILVVTIAAALPRLVVLVHERNTILTAFVDKNDRFATTLVEHGTFGFLPGVPSAYTQPLYGWFLAAIYWPIGRHWWAVGLAQVVVSIATALIVLEIGTRLRSTGIGVTAALITTLHPYVVWHDMHANREVLDGLTLAALTLLTLIAYEKRSLPWATAAGAVGGLAILGNARLTLLPLVVGIYIAWWIRPWTRALLAVAVVAIAAAVVVSPWVIRNKVQVGCFAITTDARALWKANNVNTYRVLQNGGWIDDVPPLAGAPPWPELAADLTLEGKQTTVDECAQMRLYRHATIEFWKKHPGAKAKLAAQAVRMLWTPVPSESDSSGSGIARTARRTIEPAYVVLLYLLAIAGLFFAPRRFVSLALALLAYNTVLATIFAGTVRYRVPWDFLLALLAAFTLAEILAWVRARRSTRTADERGDTAGQSSSGIPAQPESSR